MRLFMVMVLMASTLTAVFAQAKRNPFVEPPVAEKSAPPKTDKKPNPFTDPKTNPNTKPAEKSTDVPGELAVESKDPVIVPFIKLPSGHFLVKVKLNGKGPYNLIFDTGAPMMLLNSRIAKQAGVKGGGLSLFGSFSPENLKSLEVGSAVAAKVPAVVLDHPTVSAISDAFESEYGKIEGIVGFPFFARFATTVDYQKGELTLVPNGYKPGEFMSDLQTRLTAMSQQKPDAAVVAPAAAWGMNISKKQGGGDATADGVTIIEITPGSPCDKAGLKVGDRLLTLDGRWTDSAADTFRASGFVKPGTTVIMEVKRDGAIIKLKVKPVKGL